MKENLKTTRSSDNINIKTEIITRDKDPVNLRLREAYHICNKQPYINSCEECSELADLLFEFYLYLVGIFIVGYNYS